MVQGELDPERLADGPSDHWYAQLLAERGK
jgi:hypothetical protein